MHAKELLTEKAAAEALQISRTSFWRMRKSGQVKPSAEINRRQYYSIHDLAKAIEPKKK